MAGKNNIFKRPDKTMHIAEWFYTYNFVEPILPTLSKTFITPNMITLFNMVFSIMLFYEAFNGNYILCAIGIQVYLFLDILDGNLARYKNMKSELGAKLDTISDLFFYNLIFIFLGINRVKLIILLITVLLINIYGIISTFYIVPRLKKLTCIKRRGLKKFFIDRGFIIGMDLGTLDIITSVFLLFSNIKSMFLVIILGYLVDIFFRIIELKRNQKLNINIMEE